MSSDLCLLDDLLSELKGAVKEKDWDKLNEVDQAIRAEIERLNAAGVSDETFKMKIASMAKEYANLSEEVTKIRDELGAELRKLNQDHRAINQYLNNK